MSDWKDVRISDEEFLKGIYEKAEVYQEQNMEKADESDQSVSVQKKGKRHFRNVTTGLSLAASCGLAIIGGMKIKEFNDRQKASSLAERAMYRSVDEEETSEVEEYVVPEEAETIEVLGCIDSLEVDQDNIVLYISVDEQDENDLPDVLSIIISEELYEKLNLYEEEHGINALQGENVLLYLESYNWQEFYKVNHDDGFYLQTTLEDGTLAYENMDGEIIEK